MTALLNLIYCYLLELQFYLNDWVLKMWGSVLDALQGIVAAIDVTGLTVGSIPSEYAWVLGATGVSQGLALVATGLSMRFLLQTIPFVRWGS